MRVVNSKFSRFIFYVSILFIITLVFQCFVLGSYDTAVSGEIDYQDAIIEDYIITDEGLSLSNFESEVLRLINEQRRNNGLNELEAYKPLQDVAKIKAQDIVENEYFSHTSPTYGTPFDLMKANGIVYRVAGENLAGNITPQNAVDAWMNSETHRANILFPDYQYTGICVIESPIYGYVFVQMFMGI